MSAQSRLAGSDRAIVVLLVAVLVFCAFSTPRSAAAHELRPAIVSAEIDGAGTLTLKIALNLEAYVAGIGPEHATSAQSPQSADYDRLRALPPDALRSRFMANAAKFTEAVELQTGDQPVKLALEAVEVPPVGDQSLARISKISMRGSVPPAAASLRWRAAPALGSTVFRLARTREEKPFFSAFQAPGEATVDIALAGTNATAAGAGLAKFAAIGFQHIIPKGQDHILFVIGLFLLSPRLRPLLAQVTGFTLAHSVTLALGIYGVVQVSSGIVEPLIAASIIYVAVENLFTDRLQRWRPPVVFGFGLLHGLGFAGVLLEVGLPENEFLAALIGFNVGVELGQLTVIAACFLIVGYWFRHRGWYRRVITMPASLAVAAVAAFWFVERVT